MYAATASGNNVVTRFPPAIALRSALPEIFGVGRSQTMSVVPVSGAVPGRVTTTNDASRRISSGSLQLEKSFAASEPRIKKIWSLG